MSHYYVVFQQQLFTSVNVILQPQMSKSTKNLKSQNLKLPFCLRIFLEIDELNSIVMAELLSNSRKFIRLSATRRKLKKHFSATILKYKVFGDGHGQNNSRKKFKARHSFFSGWMSVNKYKYIS